MSGKRSLTRRMELAANDEAAQIGGPETITVLREATVSEARGCTEL
jgi:hypothetical protein